MNGIKLLIEFFQQGPVTGRKDSRTVKGTQQIILPKTLPPEEVVTSESQPAYVVRLKGLNRDQQIARQVLDQNRAVQKPLTEGVPQEISLPSSLWEKLTGKRFDLERALSASTASPEEMMNAHELDRDRVENLLSD